MTESLVGDVEFLIGRTTRMRAHSGLMDVERSDGLSDGLSVRVEVVDHCGGNAEAARSRMVALPGARGSGQIRVLPTGALLLLDPDDRDRGLQLPALRVLRAALALERFLGIEIDRDHRLGSDSKRTAVDLDLLARDLKCAGGL